MTGILDFAKVTVDADARCHIAFVLFLHFLPEAEVTFSGRSMLIAKEATAAELLLWETEQTSLASLKRELLLLSVFCLLARLELAGRPSILLLRTLLRSY